MSAALSQNLTDSVRAVIDGQLASKLKPGLYPVATPIGNLADITLRALCVMAQADHVLCEDTRHTLKLIDHYNLKVRLSAYHEHNAERSRPKILKWLQEGASVALVSDAGTPLISDPGYKLVREAVAAGHDVVSIPGPSAVLAGLVSSGLPTDSFFFAGFLPPRPAAAGKRLEALADVPATLIFFETASRLDQTLAVLSTALPCRELVIARELTKRFEEVIRTETGSSDLKDRRWKGEFVIMVSPPAETEPDWSEIEQALASALMQGSLKDAVEEIAGTFGVQRKRVYNLALQMRKAKADDDDSG